MRKTQSFLFPLPTSEALEKNEELHIGYLNELLLHFSLDRKYEEECQQPLSNEARLDHINFFCLICPVPVLTTTPCPMQSMWVSQSPTWGSKGALPPLTEKLIGSNSFSANKSPAFSYCCFPAIGMPKKKKQRGGT